MGQESTFEDHRRLRFSHGTLHRPAANSFLKRFTIWFAGLSRRTIIGLLLLTALVAFEVFNFDTTRFALADLLGDVSFAGIRWATILAIAFCAIDFAGLAHLLSMEKDAGPSTESWYLMGAWLLGASMNAIMTWWAISLTLLSHELGNEILDRAQLLHIVPVFMAVLVWLTRILFIGSISIAGSRFFAEGHRTRSGQKQHQRTDLPGQPSYSNQTVRMPKRSPRPVRGRRTPAPAMAARGREG